MDDNEARRGVYSLASVHERERQREAALMRVQILASVHAGARQRAAALSSNEVIEIISVVNGLRYLDTVSSKGTREAPLPEPWNFSSFDVHGPVGAGLTSKAYGMDGGRLLGLLLLFWRQLLDGAPDLEPGGYESWPRNRSFPDGKAAAAELFHRLRQLTEHLDNGNLSKACDVHDRAGVHEHGTYAQWGPLIRLLL